jgi:hypothetical protein
MMIANGEKPGWPFYAIWIILTLLCVPIAFLLSLFILGMIIHFVGDFIYVNGVQHITEDYLSLRVFVPVAGLLTGGVQYGLLRRYLHRMGWWVLVTTGGWLLGALLIAIPVWLNRTDGSMNLDLAFILMGLGIGTAQWPVVRRHFPRASWWIGANVVGWCLLGLITAGNTLGQSGLFTLGLLPACATAATLALLMKRAKPTPPNGAYTPSESRLRDETQDSSTTAQLATGFISAHVDPTGSS